MITRETATDIARLHADIEACEKLANEMREAVAKMEPLDIRDVFGRRINHIQMGVRSGENSQRIFYVPADLAVVVIDATIASHKAKLEALGQKAKAEILGAV